MYWSHFERTPNIFIIFSKIHCKIPGKTLRFVNSQNQAYRIAFQETGVIPVHVKTEEALVIIKLPVIGAVVHLHTSDQNVHVSEIFS